MTARRIFLLTLPLVGTAAYKAWCQTEEGRFCERMVRSELTHYSPDAARARRVHTSHASATANVARHC
jgi:hypothetical protein